MKIFYMPLEPYPERYTELLTKWTVDRFESRGHEVVTVYGQRLSEKPGIKVGAVLDAHGRSYWALTQVAELVRLLQTDSLAESLIYFDDLFTPGYEALPYIFDQLKVVTRPPIVARNHAQSVDPDDFTWPMRHWMRPFEHVVYETAARVICASTIHREMMAIAGFDVSTVDVLGLPYSRQGVLDLTAGPIDWDLRPKRVVYSSRLDAEKMPFFFLDVVRAVRAKNPDIEFEILTGAKELRSSQPGAVAAIEEMERRGELKVMRGLTKPAYYTRLSSARVQLNTARQDFISYTAIEASTFRVPTIAPCFRAFPECLRGRPSQLYTPWNADNAAAKIINTVEYGDDLDQVELLSLEQDRMLDGLVNLFQHLVRKARS